MIPSCLILLRRRRKGSLPPSKGHSPITGLCISYLVDTKSRNPCWAALPNTGLKIQRSQALLVPNFPLHSLPGKLPPCFPPHFHSPHCLAFWATAEWWTVSIPLARASAGLVLTLTSLGQVREFKMRPSFIEICARSIDHSDHYTTHSLSGRLFSALLVYRLQ